MEKTCKQCGRVDDVEYLKSYFVKRKKPGQKDVETKIFLDQKNRRWISNRCYMCHREYHRKYQGHTERSKHLGPQISKAVWAENVAARRFANLGFSVEQTEGRGPDLICKLGPWTYTVEVKRAFFSSKAWMVAKVKPKRLSDDLMAIVMPNSYVYIDSMDCHLSKAAPTGARCITSLVKEFGLHPLPTT